MRDNELLGLDLHIYSYKRPYTLIPHSHELADGGSIVFMKQFTPWLNPAACFPLIV